MAIEEGQFETFDIVEVAMNNDINEFRKMITNSAKKENIIIPKIKSTCSC